MEKTNDGFEISKYDFTNRGGGDLIGTKQSGELGLLLTNFNKDYQLMLKVKEDVDSFLDKESSLENNLMFTE